MLEITLNLELSYSVWEKCLSGRRSTFGIFQWARIACGDDESARTKPFLRLIHVNLHEYRNDDGNEWANERASAVRWSRASPVRSHMIASNERTHPVAIRLNFKYYFLPRDTRPLRVRVRSICMCMQHMCRFTSDMCLPIITRVPRIHWVISVYVSRHLLCI